MRELGPKAKAMGMIKDNPIITRLLPQKKIESCLDCPHIESPGGYSYYVFRCELTKMIHQWDDPPPKSCPLPAVVNQIRCRWFYFCGGSSLCLYCNMRKPTSNVESRLIAIGAGIGTFLAVLRYGRR